MNARTAARYWAAASGVDLRGARMVGARFAYGRLGQARLSGADLYGADLRMARLAGADLTGADLRGAHDQAAAEVDGGADDAIAGHDVDRHRLPGERGLLDLQIHALDQPQIGRNDYVKLEQIKLLLR